MLNSRTAAKRTFEVCFLYDSAQRPQTMTWKYVLSENGGSYNTQMPPRRLQNWLLNTT